MQTEPSRFKLTGIREQQRFLARLAAALVRDEHQAEDMIQDTWLAALERAPAGLGNLGAWLGRSLRNRSINVRLQARNRRAREAQSTGAEQPEGAADCASALELQQRVTAAVADLPEGVRDVIWLRYWHDLSPLAIAKRLGLPSDTIKSRLARGRKALRRKLGDGSDAEHGTLFGLLALALPPIKRPRALGSLTSLSGVILLSSKLKLVSLGLGAALGAYAITQYSSRSAPEQLGARIADESVAEVLSAPEDTGERSGQIAQRNQVEATPDGSPSASSGTPIPGSTWKLSGRVLDDHAQPVANLPLKLAHGRRDSARADAAPSTETEAPMWRSDATGAFSIDINDPAPPGARLIAADSEWATIGALLVDPNHSQENLLLVARRQPLRVLVRDLAGQPIGDAEVSLELPTGFTSRYPVPLESTLRYGLMGNTNDQGELVFAGAMRVAGTQLKCTAANYEVHIEGLPLEAEELQITLLPLGYASELLRGQVLDVSGRPVSGAQVSFGDKLTRSDEQGRFLLERLGESPGYTKLRAALGEQSAQISALKEGFLPGRLQVGRHADGSPRWPDGLTIQLGAPTLSIQGHVVDSEGRGLAGVLLWLDRLTLFSMLDGGVAEEALTQGQDDRLVQIESDSNGAFSVGGLAPGEHQLLILDQASGAMLKSAPITAGSSGLRLELNTDTLWDRVAGRLRGLDGSPHAGVRVMLMFDAGELHFQGRFVRSSSMLIRQVTTDHDGQFELFDVPQEQAYLFVVGDGVMETRFGSDTWTRQNRERLDLLAAHRVHLRVLGQGDSGPDSFSVLNELGEPMEMRIYRGKAGPAMLRAPIHAGLASDVLSLGSNAHTLVTYRAGETHSERSVVLLRGEVNEF